MILTNKFKATYDIEQIDKDFDIFVIEKESAKLNQTNVLDISIENFKARSVQYTYGRKAYVLFDKNTVIASEYRNAISQEYSDVSVQRINLLEMSEEDLKDTFFFQYRLLAQLLINSIRAPRGKYFEYNNISGKLLYHHPDWVVFTDDEENPMPYMKYFLEIKFDMGMYLNLNVKTYMKKDIYEETHRKEKYGSFYITDPKTKRFRRKLTTDTVNDKDLYVEGSYKNKKNRIQYLDFSNFEAFNKCKLGVLSWFLQDVEKYLGKYMTLEPMRRDEDFVFYETKKERNNLTNDDYTSILTARGVNIVDECHNKTSQNIVNGLIAELETHYNITPTVGALKKEVYNVRLIHEEEYYKKKNIDDPHNDNLNGYIVQHMTQENSMSLTKAPKAKKSCLFHKIILELILKNDVNEKKIMIFDWQAISNGKTWTFVRRDKNTDIKNKKEEKKHYKYTCVQIDKQGNLLFSQFDNENFPKNKIEREIRYAFEKYDKWKKTIEGLVFNDINNIHVILRSNEKTMPNILNIQKALKETNDNDLVMTQVIFNAMEAYVDIFHDDPKCIEYIEYLKEAISNKGPLISKKDLRKDMKMKCKHGKMFNRFIHENYNIWVSPEIKNQYFEDDYALENVLGIKYFIDENTDGRNVMSYNYYIGPTRNSLQSSIYNASVVRQVIADKNNEFKELLPLMAVDFIRVGEYTVLPFPFKYIREYISSIV